MTPDAALDVLAIQNLMALYCLYLDDEAMEAWKALWSPDSEMHAFRTTWRGPDEIAHHIGQADPGLHTAGVPAIVVDGDHATGRQNFLFVEKVGHALRLGSYEDTFTRLAEGWKFASRRIVFMKSTPPA
jgi:hypothetical protein